MGLRTAGTKVQVPVTENAEMETKIEMKEEIVVTETKEVVVKKPDAPAVQSGRVAPSLASLENKLDATDMGGIFPRLVGSNGAICISGPGGTSFGKYIDVQVLSLSDRKMITPVASQSDKMARKLCRASYDGVSIIDREGNAQTIEEYITSVQTATDIKGKLINVNPETGQVYEFNPLSSYKDIYCVIFNSDKNIEAAQAIGISQVSVSPTAIRQLKAFVIQSAMYVMRGQMVPSHQDCIRIEADPQSTDRGNFTVLTFGCVPMDIIAGYTPVAM